MTVCTRNTRTPMKSQYQPNDVCWITLRDRAGLHRGTVVAIFLLDSDHSPFYIVKLDDTSYTTLEARDATLMSDTPTKLPAVPLAYARSLWQEDDPKPWNN